MEQQIVIKPYEKEWHEEYLIEKENFISLFGEDCIAIEHIGRICTRVRSETFN